MTPRRQRPRRNDRGMTLIELVVSMAVMGVVLTMVTGAIVAIYNATNKVDGVTASASQVAIAMSRLDGSIRYASAIGKPVTSPNGSVSVRYLANEPDADGADAPSCFELRLDTSTEQLQQRRWASGETAGSAHWVPLATGIEPSAAGGAAPFTVSGLGEGGSTPNQQLRVRFDAVSGTGPYQERSVTDIEFTAFNAEIDPSLGRPVVTAEEACGAGGTP